MAESGEPPPSGEAPAEESSIEEGPERTSLRGRVRTDVGEPVADRAIAIVDGEGERFDLVTDGAGEFALDDVAVPYDLAVEAASSGTLAVYLGLRRTDPTIDLFEREGLAVVDVRQRLRLGLRVPVCPESRVAPDRPARAPGPPNAEDDAPPCAITIATVSATGSGSVALPFTPGGVAVAAGPSNAGLPAGCTVAPLLAEVEHTWSAGVARSVESIDVHAFGACAARPGEPFASYLYGTVEGIEALPGEALDLGMVDLSWVPLRARLSAGVVDPPNTLATLEGWKFTTEVTLEVGPGASAPLAVVAAPIADVWLPAIGLGFRARVRAEHPRGSAELSGGYHRSGQAWSGAVPFTRAGSESNATAALALGLALDPGPDVVRPTPFGLLSRLGLGFAWKGARPSLATLAVADLDRGRRFRLFTNDDHVSLERLAELGLRDLEPGPHVLDLSTTPSGTVDDITSPESDVRDRRLDPRRAGSAAYLRVPFEVVD